MSGMCQDLYRNIQVKFVSIDCQDHSEVLVGNQTYVYIYDKHLQSLHDLTIFDRSFEHFNSISTVS